MSTSPSFDVLHASAELLREMAALLDSEQVRDLVARTRAHLAAANETDPDWWRSPTSKDLAEACHDLEDALAVIDSRRREQERAARVDGADAEGSAADLEEVSERGADDVAGGTGGGAGPEGDDDGEEPLEEALPLLARHGFVVQERKTDGGVRLVSDEGEVDVPAFDRLLDATKDLAQVLEPLVVRDSHRIEDLQALVKGVLKGLELRRIEVQRARR